VPDDRDRHSLQLDKRLRDAEFDAEDRHQSGRFVDLDAVDDGSGLRDRRRHQEEDGGAQSERTGEQTGSCHPSLPGERKGRPIADA
jgi:hypothetical protein